MIDDRYAELHYRLGQCLFEAQQFSEAEAAFARARDEDICPLRAVKEISNMVKQTAHSWQAPLVDFESLLTTECQSEQGHGAPGQEYFVDHVHLTVEATGLLAAGLIERLSEERLVEPRTDWRQVYLPQVREKIRDRIDPQAEAAAQRNIAKVFSWAGKIEDGGRAALAALAIEPDDRECLFIAGAYLKQAGQWAEGTDLYRRALELELAENPDDLEARQFLAEALAEQGKLDEAAAQYRQVLKLRPMNADVHRGLAQVLARQGQAALAREHYHEALRLDPTDDVSRRGLDSLGP